MSKVGLIIQREYSSRVRKRSFIIMTFLGPILFAAVVIGGVLAVTSETTTHQIIVADPTGIAASYNAKGILFKSSETVIYSFREEPLSIEDFDASEYTLQLELTEEAYAKTICQLHYKSYPSGTVQNKIRNDLEEVIERERLKKKELSYDEYKSVKAVADMQLIDNDKPEEGESHKETQAAVGIGFAVLIYMFIFIYGVQVMRGVIEEKTSRVVEVIVSSVKPFQLMLGKIVGIGLVGLTQFLMWVILGSVVMAVAQTLIADFATAIPQAGNLPVQDIDPAEVLGDSGMLRGLFMIPWGIFLGSFIYYFLGGYLLYGSLFAAIGAAVDSETDTQQFMLPVTVPLIFAYIVSFLMIENPEGTAGVIFSQVPFTSPIVMMVRVGMGMDGVWWQLFLSMALLAITFVAIVWLAGRIYRTGILMYGKKASYRELWKWLFYKG